MWTFRDARVVRFKAFDTPAEALEAAGLAEWAMSREDERI